MNSGTDKYLTLRRRFAHIIKPNSGSRHSMQLWGFEVGDGWYNIIEKLFLGIEEEMKSWPDAQILSFEVQQVKEKFGGLRFYYSGYTPEIGLLVDKAEEECFHTCEVCGERGKLRHGSWIKVLCREHWMKKATNQLVMEVTAVAEQRISIGMFGDNKGKPVTKIIVKSDKMPDLEHRIAKVLDIYTPKEDWLFKVGQIVKCNMKQAKIDFGSFEGTTVHANMLKDAETFRFEVTEVTLNGYKMVRVHDKHPMPDISNIDAHKLFESAEPENGSNGNENNVE
jgi:hypothetical protein